MSEPTSAQLALLEQMGRFQHRVGPYVPYAILHLLGIRRVDLTLNACVRRGWVEDLGPSDTDPPMARYRVTLAGLEALAGPEKAHG